LRKSSAVEVEWGDLPEQYMKQKIETSADKRLIAEDLKAGATSPGARLVENFSLQIR
jgi:hypothetical protein